MFPGNSDNNLSLEQQLVQQLSSALNQEENSSTNASANNLDNFNLESLGLSDLLFDASQTQQHTQHTQPPHASNLNLPSTHQSLAPANEPTLSSSADLLDPDAFNAILNSLQGHSDTQLSMDPNILNNDFQNSSRPKPTPRPLTAPQGPTPPTGRLDLAHAPSHRGPSVSAPSSLLSSRAPASVQAPNSNSHQQHNYDLLDSSRKWPEVSNFQIDSEVSSIRNVLQSFLQPSNSNSASLNDRIASLSADLQRPEPSRPQAPKPAPSAANNFDSSLSLDTGLIESIKAAMAATKPIDITQPLTSQPPPPTGIQPSSRPGSTGSAGSAGSTVSSGPGPGPRALAARNIPALQPPNAPLSLPMPRPSSASSFKPPQFVKPRRGRPSPAVKSKPVGDAQSSDPDTLRAIQQALLSALDPGAAKTAIPKGTPNEVLLAPAPPKVSMPARVIDKTKEKEKKEAEKAEKRKAKKEADQAAKKRKTSESVAQSRDNDLRTRVVKRAHQVYGENDTKEKLDWIEEEFKRRKQKQIIRSDINKIVANAVTNAKNQTSKYPQMARRTIDARSKDPNVLSRQPRQLVSTNLSYMFKKSNSVIEPRIEPRTSTATAPYILVPSPSRPKYKLDKKAGNDVKKPGTQPSGSKLSKSWGIAHNDKKVDTPDLNKPKANDNDNPAPANKDIQIPKQSVETTPENNPENPDTNEKAKPEESVKNKDASEKSGESKDQPDNSKDDQSNKADQSKDSPKDTPKDTSKDTPKDASKETPPEDDTSEEAGAKDPTIRPKHRYTLIGKHKWGAPPNISAILQI